MGEMAERTITLFHGSDHVVRQPVHLGGKADNDYGNGFYTTEYEDRARSWAVLNGNPDKSVVNVYELDNHDLNILDLNEHGVLVWIAEVAANRGTEQAAAAMVADRLIEAYKVDTEGYDIIKGYRADDSYTQVLEAFLLNQINIYEVKRLFYKGSLGNQIFLRSPEAFHHIKWIDAYMVVAQETDRQTDYEARKAVNQFLSARMKEILLEGYVVPGITARYAVQNKLAYHKEGDCYEQTGVS